MSPNDNSPMASPENLSQVHASSLQVHFQDPVPTYLTLSALFFPLVTTTSSHTGTHRAQILPAPGRLLLLFPLPVKLFTNLQSSPTGNCLKRCPFVDTLCWFLLIMPYISSLLTSLSCFIFLLALLIWNYCISMYFLIKVNTHNIGLRWIHITLGFPGGSVVRIHLQCRRLKRRRFDPWVRKIPWRRAWQPIPLFLPGESHGQRSLAGYSP